MTTGDRLFLIALLVVMSSFFYSVVDKINHDKSPMVVTTPNVDKPTSPDKIVDPNQALYPMYKGKPIFQVTSDGLLVVNTSMVVMGQMAQREVIPATETTPETASINLVATRAWTYGLARAAAQPAPTVVQPPKKK